MHNAPPLIILDTRSGLILQSDSIYDETSLIQLDTVFGQVYIDVMAQDIFPDQSLALRALPLKKERSIVLAALRGDQDAFRELYKVYREPIWIMIISLVGDSLQAQDVLQNVFFKAFRGLGDFRFQSCLFTWIYRIALNECRNHLRKRSVPSVPLETILGSQDEIDKTHGFNRSGVQKALLRNAVMQLPLKMREVIVLKYREGLSYKEMSRILGCPPGTVASRLNRALVELEVRLRTLQGIKKGTEVHGAR